MLLVAPLAAQTRTRATPRSEVADPGKFMFLTINGRAAGEAFAPCSRSLRECALERLVLFGYDGFGGPAETAPREEVFTFASKKKTVGVFLLTIPFSEDDSVAVERVRLAFERKGKTWQFVQAGRQFRCVRGVKGWTKNLCP
jgi:hypothetical protein